MKFAFHIFTDAVSKKDLEALEKTTVKYKQSCYVYLMEWLHLLIFILNIHDSKS